jgi:LmbE family N-acetylglucosaminyl deacetylase
MNQTVLAIFAHPDDIEFVAAGTLLRLKALGWSVHYFNVANGCCGSTVWGPEETASIRLQESQQSAKLLNATFHRPICNDLEVFYNLENLKRIASVVRVANPSVILTHARFDYMEDHMETCRLAVTAAFTRSVPNFSTEPASPAVQQDVAIYHAQPHGNRTPDGKIHKPEFCVDIDDVIPHKLAMLECHKSQQEWLQSTQKMNSYLQTMLDLAEEVATLNALPCQYAEGWTKHHRLGFGPEGFDPLQDALREFIPKVNSG